MSKANKLLNKIKNEAKIFDEVGKFYVVTKPTKISLLTDILFQTDIIGMFNQVRGGLKESEIHGFYKKEKIAKAAALALLNQLS